MGARRDQRGEVAPQRTEPHSRPVDGNGLGRIRRGSRVSGVRRSVPTARGGWMMANEEVARDRVPMAERARQAVQRVQEEAPVFEERLLAREQIVGRGAPYDGVLLAQ